MASFPPNPRSVEDIFKNFAARRSAVLYALTRDVDDFFSQCDPGFVVVSFDKDNLCLYGHPDERWEVTLPAEDVPPEIPEPVLGINFARDGMEKRDWLSLVAMHTDSWLLAVAFYFGAQLNRNERNRLFSMINELPTIYEIASERKPSRERPIVNVGNKSMTNAKLAVVSDCLSNLTCRGGKGLDFVIFAWRWRNLWKSIVGLEFNSETILGGRDIFSKSLNTERIKYVNWVNRVIRQHNGLVIDSFKISFDLDKGSKSAVDNWVKVALSKKVKRLELDLLEYEDSIRDTMRNYTFPSKLFTSRQSNMAAFTGLRFLTVLSLRCVNVSDQVLESFLLHCPLLEVLSVHGSGGLVNVKVVGLALKLNSLEIVFCLGLKTIELQDTTLSSLSYLGPAVTFISKNVPKLEEVSVGMGRSGLENNVFGQLACCFNQLEILTLVIYRPQAIVNFSNIPELPKLKELVLKIGAFDDESLLQFTSLLQHSPHLERFVLQLIWLCPTKTRRRMLKGEAFRHESLKVVEICGYFGRPSDAEIAMYFIQNAPALQKLVIDPRNQILKHSSRPVEVEETARRYAHQQLTLRVPQGCLFKTTTTLASSEHELLYCDGGPPIGGRVAGWFDLLGVSELGLVDINAFTLGTLPAGLVSGAETAFASHLLIPFRSQLLFPCLPSFLPSYSPQHTCFY
nr:putative FBD-associated F-box protein At5g56700 [Ipomoea batatas]